jgi:glycosyltransferase involved in cell wall biosynthesis
MKIVHIGLGTLPAVFSPFGGAIQRRIAELAQAQARLGQEVTVFSPGRERASTTIDGVTVRLLPCHSRPPWVHLEYQIAVVADIMRCRQPVDVLHFHSQPEGALATRAIPALRVLSYDNYYFRRGRKSGLYRVYQRLLGLYDLLLPCSTYCMHASASYWDLPRPRTHVLFNGVNISQFRPDARAAEAERERLGVEGDVILYLGRICEQKGVDTLLEGYASLRAAQTPSPTLILAGPIEQFGPSSTPTARARWEARIREAGGLYVGRVPEHRLTGLLNLADVFVMPTRELEMFGMAAVEAQACGTPVVASDHGGLRETVRDGVGLRFPPGDSGALAAALARLLASPDLRKAMSETAVQNARRYAWDVIAADVDVLYREAMEAPSRCPCPN